MDVCRTCRGGCAGTLTKASYCDLLIIPEGSKNLNCLQELSGLEMNKVDLTSRPTLTGQVCVKVAAGGGVEGGGVEGGGVVCRCG